MKRYNFLGMTARQHLHLFLSILAGFALAFALLLSLTISVPLVGELLIEYPTINVVEQNEEFMLGTTAMGSLWFWAGVIGVGTLFASELWKWMRG